MELNTLNEPVKTQGGQEVTINHAAIIQSRLKQLSQQMNINKLSQTGSDYVRGGKMSTDALLDFMRAELQKLDKSNNYNIHAITKIWLSLKSPFGITPVGFDDKGLARALDSFETFASNNNIKNIHASTAYVATESFVGKNTLYASAIKKISDTSENISLTDIFNESPNLYTVLCETPPSVRSWDIYKKYLRTSGNYNNNSDLEQYAKDVFLSNIHTTTLNPDLLRPKIKTIVNTDTQLGQYLHKRLIQLASRNALTPEREK